MENKSFNYLKMIQFKYFGLILFLMISTTVSADISKFDVVQIISEEKQYYLKITVSGLLKNDDLCIYNYEGEYKCEVSEIVDAYLKDERSVEVFSKHEILHFEMLKEFNGETTLHLLKEKESVLASHLRNNFEVESIVRGNTRGMIHTKELSELDDHWINNYKIEKLFRADDGWMCYMFFYGIKENNSKEEIIKIKKRIEELISKKESYDDYLSKLYLDNIIMIGLCSC